MHEARNPTFVHSGEGDRVRPFGTTNAKVTASCTQVCGQEGFKGKSCAKTVLVNVYPEHHPNQRIKAYILIDDQSNRSLAKSDFLTTSMKIPRKSNMCFHHVQGT